MRGGQLRRGQLREDPFEGGGDGGPAGGIVTSPPGSQRGRCGLGVSVCGGPERKAYWKPTPQAGPARQPPGPGRARFFLLLAWAFSWMYSTLGSKSFHTTCDDEWLVTFIHSLVYSNQNNNNTRTF